MEEVSEDDIELDLKHSSKSNDDAASEERDIVIDEPLGETLVTHQSLPRKKNMPKSKTIDLEDDEEDQGE